MEHEQIIRKVTEIGNGAHIFIPKEWVGSQVKVVLIARSLNIKKDVLNILEPYLEDIIGVYLVGSYARGEQDSKSDIDIIAISKNTKKEITSGKYHISISTLEGIKKTLGYYPELILPRIMEAKVILNPEILEELKKTKISKSSFKEFIKDTKSAMKMNKEIIEINKLENKENVSESVIYSLILRLRGIFLIKLLLKNKKYMKKEFLSWLKQATKHDIKKIYEVYENVRDKRKIKEKIDIDTAEDLQNLLKREISTFEA
jgi:predicted nucleotidyltransferase